MDKDIFGISCTIPSFTDKYSRLNWKLLTKSFLADNWKFFELFSYE